MNTFLRGFVRAMPPCALAFAVALCAVPLRAEPQTPKARDAWSRFIAANGDRWRAQWPKSGNRVLSLRGRSARSAGSSEAIADAFLAANDNLLGLKRDELRLVSHRESLAGSDLTYQQFYSGLPVFNGFVDLHLNHFGSVYLLTSSIAPDPGKRLRSVTPKLSPNAAGLVARTAIGSLLLPDKQGHPFALPHLEVTGIPELGIQRTNKGARLAYRVAIGPMVYVVEADAGAILEAHSLMHSVTGTGRIFIPNPVNTLNHWLHDQSDRNYAALSGAYFTRRLYNIKQVTHGTTHTYSLTGPHVTTMDLKASAVGSCMIGQTEVRKPPPHPNTPNFVYNRSQNGFEHTMVFWHIGQSQEYIRGIGFPGLWNRPIRVDAHGIVDDNSFYCGSPAGAGYLAFGDGGVDDAEDADVVLHEYGHAIQDASSPGRYVNHGQVGAMGEGFGDYWAFSANPGGRWAPCFAEWDGQGSCLRRVDKNKRYPHDYVDEVHADGEIWSRGLFDMFNRLGKDTANKIILQSHYLIAADPDFSKGVEALIDADEALFDGVNKKDICSIFIDRGITAPPCGYWMRLSWPKLGADVDLHLRPPEGADDTAWDYPGDVAFYNLNPNWGDPDSTADDPILYHDCITDCTEEQITAPVLPEHGTYKVMVHYYSDHGLGPTNVRIEVYKGGDDALLFSDSRTLANPTDTPDGGDVWFPYDIVVPEGDGAAPRIVPVNRVIRGTNGGSAPPKK